MIFQNRWMILGTLTTVTPLHVGDGDSTTRSQLTNSQNGQEVDINSVCTDKDGRAAIPGTTLKGNLRSYARRAGVDSANFENLFGSDDAEKEDSVGGKIEFYNALALSFPTFATENQPAYWDAQRGTAVVAGVAIDRRTKTASEERLFHHEFVPSGSEFSLMLTGQNLSDSELEDVLFALDGFNHGEIAIGAGEQHGWGEMIWQLTDLRRIAGDEVASWIHSGGPAVGYAALSSLADAERQSWLDKINSRQVSAGSFSRVSLVVTLNFQSHFLVNDPSQTGTMDEGKPAHAPLRDTDGCMLLPASSMRGALRSQAEKILRTIHGEQAACNPDDRGARPACKALYEVSDLQRLCPVCQVFGAPGWRSPLQISAFKTADPIGADKMRTQEFLAIDRFTGGGVEGAKFNATSVYRPSLSGTIAIDLKALERANVGRWALGLLTLSLRDLIEGDMRLGFGAAKGYGAVRAKIRANQLPAWSECPAAFKSDLREDQWQPAVFNALPDDQLRTVMELWVMELEELRPPPIARGANA